MKETRKFYIEDLMIGDWVRWEGCAGSFRVCSIDGRSLMVEIEKHEPEKACGWNADVFIFELFGIPITPEILEKNGFVKRDTYIWNNPKMRCTAYRFGRKYWDIRVTYRARDYRPTRINIDNILYVHELQHALRLAGVEKEIEL